MQFYDDKGTARLAVGLGGLPGLILFDPSGRARMVLGTDVTGAPSIALRPNDAHGGVYLSSSEDGTADLVFVDKASHARAELRMIGSEGAPSLTLTNKDQATAITLTSGETGPVISTGMPSRVVKQLPGHWR
jgi:hypothetical protein